MDVISEENPVFIFSSSPHCSLKIIEIFDEHFEKSELYHKRPCYSVDVSSLSTYCYESEINLNHDRLYGWFLEEKNLNRVKRSEIYFFKIGNGVRDNDLNRIDYLLNGLLNENYIYSAVKLHGCKPTGRIKVNGIYADYDFLEKLNSKSDERIVRRVLWRRKQLLW